MVPKEKEKRGKKRKSDDNGDKGDKKDKKDKKDREGPKEPKAPKKKWWDWAKSAISHDLAVCTLDIMKQIVNSLAQIENGQHYIDSKLQ